MRRQTIILIAALAMTTGCNLDSFRNTKQRNQYATVGRDPGRDPAAAAQHNAEAVRLMEQGHHDQAEHELKLALDADLFCGPAHNNLGTVYLHKEDYYHAAWEFQYAAKLMPGKAEPLYNLAMVYEAAGQLDDSHEWYAKAHDLEPENIRITCGLARLRVRTNQKDETTQQLLRQIILQAPASNWRQWAREQLMIMSRPDDTILHVRPREDT